ncbi:MAG: hypothetical protein P8H43_00260 [Crocinitomicaceae bacterium]|nr:hypothetical protein [Crocinitomicaceae bacterium]
MKNLLLFGALVLCLNSYGQSKKQQIEALQGRADSITNVLKFQLKNLNNSKITDQSEIEALYLKEEDIKLAKLYLRKAKRNVKVGNIVSTVTVSISAVGTALLWKSFEGGWFDLTGLLLIGDGVLIGVGQAINIPLKISAKKNIELAKELINIH